MGKRSAAVDMFLGNMGSMQREPQPSIQREDELTMETELERIAAKARCEPKLRFTSLAHHITRDRVQRNLLRIPQRSAAGVDGQTATAAKESFGEWIEPMLQSIHRQGYRAPAVRRVYIPKPGKTEKRPLGVPTISDRALQRSAAEVLSAIYEQDLLPCSFGGRPGLSAHHALATLNEVIAGGKISWVLEADAGGLKPGRPATLTVESGPGVTYPARIARVDTLAKPRVPGSPVQYFAVTLKLDRTDTQVMKPGQRVQAILLLEERKGALLAPRQAVFDREGRSVVFRRKPEGGFDPVEVKLGPSTMGRVVVESGIKKGDVLAMRDPTRPAGTPEVKPPKPPAASPAQGSGRRVMISIR